MTIDTAVILAGAVARGAYEAAALTVALPKLNLDLGKTIFVGTSAGALNAALWAVQATPSAALAASGKEVEDIWRSFDDSDVFRLGVKLPLDTSPLRATIAQHFKPAVIKKNLAAGSLGGLAVVATSFGETVAGSRARVFYQTAGHAPEKSPSSTIDYVRAVIDRDHLMASSAVPVVFPPIEIGDAWHMDGGVRLNTPLSVGLAFGARRLVIITTHTAEYPRRPGDQAERPSGNDAAASILHNMLADGLIEDLRQLKARNAEPRKDDTLVQHVVIAPPAGLLAREAREALDGSPGSRVGVPSALGHDVRRKLRYRGIDVLLGRLLGDGVGRDELLSYLYFEPEFFARQLALGAAHAKKAVAKGWTT